MTFLLFLKMAKETGTEEQLPAGYRWDDLQRQEGVEQLGFYRSLLVHLGNEGSGRVQAIFHDANTALRLPTGIFYAQGVKTNVLFFTRGATEVGNTQKVWVYDLRTNMPAFGKRTPLTHAHFAAFETCYCSHSDGTSERIDQGEEGRFRCFTRQDIAKRGDNLDISWLKDDNAHSADGLPEPEEIAALIRERLQTVIEEMDALAALLEGEEVEV